MMEYLFSYGTLQLEKVQIESFGRVLNGSKDVLKGYRLDWVEIRDETVLAKSEQAVHPMAVPSNNVNDMIEGVVFEITAQELKQADEYEVDAYKRILVTLASGREAWVYVSAATTV